MGVADTAGAHFAAIMAAATEARARMDAVLDVPPEAHEATTDALIAVDEACADLIDLILDSADTPRVMLALAGDGKSGPAGAP